MKVLCLTENLGSGGAERQLTGLAVMLKKRGYTVKVITYIKKQFHLDQLDSNGVHYELVEKAANRYTRVFYLYRALKSYAPDVVISYLPAPSMSVCLVRMLGLKFRLIVSERSSTREISIKDRVKFFLYRRATYVVPNSESEGDMIRVNFPKLNAKTVVITNFTDVDKFSPAVRMVADGDALNLLVVGRVIAAKNVLRFVEAVKVVIDKGYDLKVKWIGSVYDKPYYEQVVRRIADLGLDDIVALKDHLSSVEHEYQRADVFCLPSLYEGYPNVICEAMSCGLPVLCSAVCDNPRIVEHAKSGFLFDPLSVDSIVEAILSLMNLEAPAREFMGQYNRQVAVDKFSQQVFVNNYINLIESDNDGC